MPKSKWPDATPAVGVKPARTGSFGLKLPLIRSSLRVPQRLWFSQEHSPSARERQLPYKPEPVKGGGGGGGGGERGGVEKFPITYLSAAPNRKVHCWAEKVGMFPPLSFLFFFSWRVFGRGQSSLWKKGRALKFKQVRQVFCWTWTEEALFLYWRGLAQVPRPGYGLTAVMNLLRALLPNTFWLTERNGHLTSSARGKLTHWYVIACEKKEKRNW